MSGKLIEILTVSLGTLRWIDRPGERLNLPRVVHKAAVSFGERAGRQDQRRRLGHLVLENVLSDDEGNLGYGRAQLLGHPRLRIATDDPGGGERAAPRLLDEFFERRRVAAGAAHDQLDTPAVRALLVTHDKLDVAIHGMSGEPLIVAVGGNGADHHRRFRGEPANEFEQQPRLLAGHERREHYRDLVAAHFADEFLQAVPDNAGDVLPGRGLGLRAAAELWMGNAPFVVDVLPPEPALVAHPPVVYPRVETRFQAVNAVFVVIDANRAPGAAPRTDRRGALQEPYPLLEQEILVQQAAHRAEVHDVALQRVVQW